MKKGRILFGVGFFLLTISGYSQEYAFKVLANKGANEFKSGEGWQAVKTGASLKAGDELKVSENSYLGLVHSSGKPLEVKTAGNYKVADLAAKVGAGNSGVMNKTVDFILSSNSAEAKKNRLSATGAVHRGVEGSLHVLLPPPQNASIFGKTTVVEWESKVAGPYVVTVKNIFEDDLMKIETPEKSVYLDLNDPKLVHESAILVKVTVKGESNEKIDGNVVKRLSAADQEKIKKSYGEMSTDESAFSKFIQAGFYEQNGLLIDALTAYEEAIKMAPDVEDFKVARDEFLIRNKLSNGKQ